MSGSGRSRLTLGVRLLGGAVVAGVATAAVVLAISAPWPTHEREPVRVTATPAPADAVLACSGPLLALGRDTTQAALLSVAAQPTPVFGAEPAESLIEAGSVAAPDVAEAVGPLVYTATPVETTRVDLAAATSATASADDLRGLATAACRPPVMESWLVGGSGATGAADLVVLTNPGTVAATVQLTVYGAQDEQRPPGGADVIVPAGSQRVIPLAGVALGEPSPVVRVTAAGAPVAATLQTSITRTLTPGGVDLVGAITVPTNSVVIPAVVITESAAAAAVQDATTVLRMLAPTSAGTATVTVTRFDGVEPASEPVTVPLTKGIPAEVDLAGLAAGTYTVRVSADVPLVAAVWNTTGFGDSSDFTWGSAAPDIAVPTAFAVAPGATPRLTMSNNADEPVEVTVRDALGEERKITVPAHSGARVDVVANSIYVLDPGNGAVQASITYAGAGALSGYALWPANTVTAPIVVYP